MKLLLALLAAMLLIAAASFWAWRAAAPGTPCEDAVLHEEGSSDGRWLAAAYTRRCGGSVTTHVALRAAGAQREAEGDVFVAAGEGPVRLLWTEPRELVIETPAQRVLVEETSWRSIGVRLRRVR